MSLDTPRVAAIKIIHPTAITFRGDDAWDDDGNQITIDESAVATKIAEIEVAEPMKKLRRVRNAKLTETDWVVTMHKEKGTNIPAAWKTYRDALRDITDSATSLDDVTWPEKP